MNIKTIYLKTHKRQFLILLFGFLLLGYFFLIWTNFNSFLSRFSHQFGYLDSQHHWRVLDDFVNLRMPYRDYFLSPSHGWFYLLIQSVPYLLLKRTFLGVLVIEFLFLPVVGIILSYFVAKNVLRKKHLIFIFLFFCLLFGVNYNYTSPRHLIAELSLSFFILYFLKDKTKYLLASGIIAGLSILTSFEYGAALNIAIIFIFFASFFSDAKLTKPFFKRFLLGEIAILAPFFSWLYVKDVLRDYWQFTFGFMRNFYYASPCANDSFPRLSEIKTLISASKLLIFNLPIEFLQKLNFYLVFSFFVIGAFVLFVLFLKNKKFSRKNLVKLSLVFYGLLIFIRTIDTPCVGYFTYGLVPFFLLLTFLIEEIALWSWQRKAPIFKALGVLGIGVIFFWLILTEDTGYLVKIFGKRETQPSREVHTEEFYPPAGWFIRKDFTRGYKEIANFIVENTNKDDFLYVYPWGIYNNLTGRRAPNSLPTAAHFLVGEEFVARTKTELETKKPKFVVINLYNNLAIATYGKLRKDINRYFSLGYEDGPVFAGEGNIIERYILENYEPVLKNELALVMKQRSEPIKVETKKKEKYIWRTGGGEKIELQSMEKRDNDGNYKILGEKANWVLVFEDPIRASDISVEFKLDGDFSTKHLTRYFLNFYALTVDGAEEEVDTIKAESLARKTWQTAKIEFDQPKDVKMVKIEIGENTGLIWWLNPYNLTIREISFYEYF